jgi:hypothetical protein
VLGKGKSDSGDVHQTHLEVDAYNAAFDDLGLEWRLDHADYEYLCTIEGEENRIRAYLETHHAHLLKVYDLDFLCGLIAEARWRRRLSLA